jgi:two-component system NtrC family sensor kinase
VTSLSDSDIEKLRESEEKYRQMVEMAGEAVLAVNSPSGTVEYANLRALALTGFERDKLIGMPLWDLYSEEEKENVRKQFHRTESEGHEFRKRRQLKRSDGSFIPVDTTTAVISYGGKKTVQQICRAVIQEDDSGEEPQGTKEMLKRDIQNCTEELRQAQLQLLQSEKLASLGNLVAGVAHEINTPLGALVSNINSFERSIEKIKAILLHSPKSEVFLNNTQLPEILDNIDKLAEVNKTASERIVRIVNSLRRFARTDQSRKETVDVHEGLDSTLTLVHHQIKNRIELVKDYGDVPKLECYPDQLNQVFMNIIVNAVQAIEGKGTITIRTYETDGQVRIEISDSGSGIPDDKLDEIFEPGFTTKGSGVGTGLGLSIVRHIIEEHKGTIEVESEIGKGTTFRIILPAR